MWTSTPPSQAVVNLSKASKNFDIKAKSFKALDNVDLTISRGVYVAIIGRSGSGKPTLMNMISGIDLLGKFRSQKVEYHPDSPAGFQFPMYNEPQLERKRVMAGPPFISLPI